LSKEENPKRGYTHHEKSPGLSRDATPEERREYNRWYYRHVRGNNYAPVDPEAKAARYRAMSEEYWRGYCEKNDLDPNTWEEVKEEVQTEKAYRKLNWRTERATRLLRENLEYRRVMREEKAKERDLKKYYEKYGDDPVVKENRPR